VREREKERKKIRGREKGKESSNNGTWHIMITA